MKERHQFSNTVLRPTGRVDGAAGIIAGAAVATVGPARGHRDRLSGKPLFLDRRTLETVRDCAVSHGGGLKVLMNHEAGAGDIVGVLRNFRIDGETLRADLHLLRSTPHRAYILEVATEAPSSFGLSIAFSGRHETLGDRALARCVEIYSADLVAEPAANPNGLFSSGQPLVDGAKFEDLVKAHTVRLKSKADAIRYCVEAYPNSHHALLKRTNIDRERIIL